MADLSWETASSVASPAWPAVVEAAVAAFGSGDRAALDELVASHWEDLWADLARRSGPAAISPPSSRHGTHPLVLPPRAGRLGWWPSVDRYRAAHLWALWVAATRRGDRLSVDGVLPRPPSRYRQRSRAHLELWERIAQEATRRSDASAPVVAVATLSRSEVGAVWIGAIWLKVALAAVFPSVRIGETVAAVVPSALASSFGVAWRSAGPFADLRWLVAPAVGVPQVEEVVLERLGIVAASLSAGGSTVRDLWELSGLLVS